MNMKYLILNQRTTGKYSYETINNRPHILTDVVAIEAPSVMNRIMYPEDIVLNTMHKLKGKPAPASHPKVNGEPISASHPLAINAHNIGGFVSDVRRDGSRVIAQVAIDIETANKDQRGKETIKRIENGEKIGFSTGLPWDCREEKGELNGDEYDYVINDIEYDHLAILLNEQPAGKNTYSIVNCNVINSSGYDARVEQPSSGDIMVHIENKVSKSSKRGSKMDKDVLINAIVANPDCSLSDKSKLDALNEIELVAAITNAKVETKVTLDDAKSIIEAEGLAIVNAAEYVSFDDNKDEFAEFMAAKKAAREELIAGLVTNSKLSKEQLEALPEDVLKGMQESLSLQASVDYSARGGQLLNERQNPNSEAPSFADYS